MIIGDGASGKRKSATPAYGNSVEESDKDAPEFSSGFDYVMVFKMKEEAQSKYAKHCMHEMFHAGLEIFAYLSVQDDEVLVLIRCPLERLKQFTDQINYKLKIDPSHLEKMLLHGDAEHRIKPIHITNDREISPYTPYEHIYLEYGRRHDQGLYYVPYGFPDPFYKSVRLKLTNMMLRAPKRDGGCALEINQLLHRKKILAFYPLHDRTATDEIKAKIWKWGIWPWNIPAEELREYFGEKIALYYVFVGHYSLWLWGPAIIGIAFQLVVWATGPNFSSPVLPFYSLVITVWSICMLEYWKRQEATTALFWGMSDFEQLEQDRPEFVGETIKSYVNGADMTYFPSTKSKQRRNMSLSVILSFICAVVGTVAGIYILRFQLQARASTQSVASTVASILNTVQIQIFNYIYQIVARKLTDLENHRTDTEYEDSLIVKLFVFQFINSYASFFFLAFIAGNLARPNNAPTNFLGECGATNCMEPLSINVAIIFGTRLTLGNFLDIFLPWLSHKLKFRAETKGIGEDRIITPAEKDYMLLNYETMIESINNYADTAIQYGFSLLFITALPIASSLSLISNYFKVKFNSWKICDFYQRPVPEGVQDIGTWLSIFQVISVASVITNAGLICFTMNVLWDYSLQGRLWIFIGFQWVLISIQFFAQAVIPDVPEEVEIQLQRSEFINEKIIEKVEDEDFDEVDDHDSDDGLGNDEDDDDENKNKSSKGLFGLKKKKNAKMKNLKNDYPMAKYPHGQANPLSWPRVIKMDPNAKEPSHKHLAVSPDDITPEVSTKTEPPVPKEPTAMYY